MTDNLPIFLTIADVAELLRTTVRGVYARRARGIMPRPVQKRPLLWHRDDLLRWIREGCASAPTSTARRPTP